MEQILNYQGNIINVKNDDKNYISATDMARPFGKIPFRWLELPSTQSAISKILIYLKSADSDNQIVITKRGAPHTGGGTWIHILLAFELARWLSEDFGIWMASEFLKKRDAEYSLSAPVKPIEKDYKKMLQDPELIKALLRTVENGINRDGYMRKLIVIDQVISLETCCKGIMPLNPDGSLMSNQDFCADLRQRGILYYCGRKNYPSHNYLEKGWFVVKDRDVNKNGKTFIVQQTMVTMSGKMNLYNLYHVESKKHCYELATT